MKVISLSGAIGSGKDTAYELLSEHLTQQGFVCKKLSFANKLKDNVARMFYWDRARLEWDFPYKEGNTLDDGTPDPACELLGMTRREVMQIYGTDAVRNGLHPDAWIITLRMDILHGVYDGIDYGFVTDARFINELQFARDLNGTIIKITKPADSESLTNKTAHQSEHAWQAWTDWDIEIENRIDKSLPIDESKALFKQKLIYAFDAVNFSDEKMGASL